MVATGCCQWSNAAGFWYSAPEVVAVAAEKRQPFKTIVSWNNFTAAVAATVENGRALKQACKEKQKPAIYFSNVRECKTKKLLLMSGNFWRSESVKSLESRKFENMLSQPLLIAQERRHAIEWPIYEGTWLKSNSSKRGRWTKKNG